LTVKARVVVAMSGGVDSSVAAALLVKQGYDVIGMMLRLWSEPGSESANRCCTPDSLSMARRVALRLGIPFYAVDSQEYFRNTVVNFFLEGYNRGVTPNPCLVCNRTVRWEFLLNRALALGADHMATGHYARLRKDEQGRVQLLKAVDSTKDQSYVLHVLGQEQLSRTLFPLGEYTKTQVRDLGRQIDLPAAERSDSQDLCFLGNGSYRDFLIRHSPGAAKTGPILNTQGEKIGEHNGLAFYTVGQRKGIRIASPKPLYVIDKVIQTNSLIVGRIEDLGRRELNATGINWISGEVPSKPFQAQIKIRYKAKETTATITPQEDNTAQVLFDEPVRDITPGQAAVFYQGEICLGGGIIQ
jgi:tRNA-uridine 2-sulfurtransferase